MGKLQYYYLTCLLVGYVQNIHKFQYIIPNRLTEISRKISKYIRHEIYNGFYEAKYKL